MQQCRRASLPARSLRTQQSGTLQDRHAGAANAAATMRADFDLQKAADGEDVLLLNGQATAGPRVVFSPWRPSVPRPCPLQPARM